jgi:hypothetical protein
MYLFHFGGTLLRPLYSETRASTIVPECEICKCNSAVGIYGHLSCSTANQHCVKK